jgi:hypothetical protein
MIKKYICEFCDKNFFTNHLSFAGHKSTCSKNPRNKLRKLKSVETLKSNLNYKNRIFIALNVENNMNYIYQIIN